MLAQNYLHRYKSLSREKLKNEKPDPKVISDGSMGFGNSESVRGDTSILDGLFRMLKSQALNEGDLAAEDGFVFHLADSVMRAPTRDFFGL